MKNALALILLLSLPSISVANPWQPPETQVQKWDNQQRRLAWEESMWLADNSIKKTVILGQQGYKVSLSYRGVTDIRVYDTAISFIHKGKRHIYHGEFTVMED